MALVKTIKDRLTDDTIYPITKADAVYLSDNETTVEGALGNLSTISSIGDGTIAVAINTLNSNLKVLDRNYYNCTIVTELQNAIADMATSYELNKFQICHLRTIDLLDQSYIPSAVYMFVLSKFNKLYFNTFIFL